MKSESHDFVESIHADMYLYAQRKCDFRNIHTTTTTTAEVKFEIGFFWP